MSKIQTPDQFWGVVIFLIIVGIVSLLVWAVKR